MSASNGPRARRADLGEHLGSVAAPLLWGIVFANLLHGVPINSSQDFAGNFW